MNYPIAELCDRLSIEKLKVERIPDYVSTFVVDAQKEYAKRVPEEIESRVYDYLFQLKEWNGKIWDLESDIRKGKEGELGLEEVGRRALAIRDLNGERIRVKNQIAELFDEYLEKKFNHASQYRSK